MLSVRNALLVATAVFAGLGVYLSVTGQAAGVIIVNYAAAVSALIFYYLPQFKKFSVFGLSATLQEQIGEAEELIGRLRGITLPLATVLFSALARIGKWDSHMPMQMQLELAQKIEEEMRAIGVKDVDIEHAKEDWHRYNILDLAEFARQQIVDMLNNKQDDSQAQAALKEINNLCSSIDRIEQVGDEIRDFLDNSPSLSEEDRGDLKNWVKEALEDVDYYIAHKKFRQFGPALNQDDQMITARPRNEITPLTRRPNGRLGVRVSRQRAHQDSAGSNGRGSSSQIDPATNSAPFD